MVIAATWRHGAAKGTKRQANRAVSGDVWWKPFGFLPLSSVRVNRIRLEKAGPVPAALFRWRLCC